MVKTKVLIASPSSPHPNPTWLDPPATSTHDPLADSASTQLGSHGSDRIGKFDQRDGIPTSYNSRCSTVASPGRHNRPVGRCQRIRPGSLRRFVVVTAYDPSLLAHDPCCVMLPRAGVLHHLHTGRH